jgi:hypothetical protein
MNKRCIMRIEVLPEVLETLADTTEQVGSTQVSVISRLLEWFVQQSDVTQAAILGLYPTDIQNELPRMIFEQMRAERPRLENLRQKHPTPSSTVQDERRLTGIARRELSNANAGVS